MALVGLRPQERSVQDKVVSCLQIIWMMANRFD